MQIANKICLGLAFVLFLTGSVCAQDEDATATARKAMNRAKRKTTASMMKSMSAAELTEEQKASAVEVIERHMESLMQAKQALEDSLTEEQKAKKQAAIEQGKADGVKGKALMAASEEALELTEEEQATRQALKAEVKRINSTIKSEITELLTEDQLASLNAARKKRSGKKKKAENGEGEAPQAMEEEGTSVETTQAVSLKLPNMTCGGCASSVQTSLAGVEGITDIQTDVPTNSCSFNAPQDLDVAATLNELVESGNSRIKNWTLDE